jgi:aminoacrylate peracid reductase
VRKPVIVGRSERNRYTFAPAVISGEFLFISGTTASTDDGSIVGPGDIVEQTRFIFEKMHNILESVGATFDDVVMTRDYFVTTVGYNDTAAVRREVFGDTFPAATGVRVAGLLREGALIEIEAIVHLARDR